MSCLGSHRVTQGTSSIAIVGIGCRFPGARNTTEFWKSLSEGRDAITTVPASRFDRARLVDRVAHDSRIDPNALTWGGFIEGIDLFDAAFFGLSPREAAAMAPEQRLALEVAWEALEDAGQVPARLSSITAGVFLGVLQDARQTPPIRDSSHGDLAVTVGSSIDGAAGRLSNALGLTGPSLVVSTDRSSSLVAVHLACQSLRTGESTLAIAGGINLVRSPETTLAFARAGLLAPDGRCRFGDARASGIARSDGVGFVVLKTLEAAMAAGDDIYAVIVGTAVNHDGARGSGFMTPSVAGQVALLKRAYDCAGVSARDVSYVEAHGTGTAAGDPVEVDALATVLQDPRGDGTRLRVGSCKTNIGHTESAAGVAGLIKVALSLEHRVLPASLHFEEPNPRIPFRGVVVQRATEAWDSGGSDLVAGVTSLGLTGTNAHVVLREAPRRRVASAEDDLTLPQTGQTEQTRQAELLVLSARTRKSLRGLAAAHVRALAGGEARVVSAYDWASACALRRTHFDERLAVVGHSPAELARELEHALESTEPRTRLPGPVKIAFVFSGQGSQWPTMGRELLEQEPAFRQTMIECDRVLAAETGWSVQAELAAGADRSRLDRGEVMQPALFAIAVSLAALWRSWGVEPAFVVGTSVGEIAAAHVAGILTLEDAAKIVCTRARLMQRLEGHGAVALAEASAERVTRALHGHEDSVSIAAYYGPSSTLLSGEASAVSAVVEMLRSEDVVVRRVNMGVASHSAQMDAIGADLTAGLASIKPQPSTVPFISTVTGARIEGPECDARYWVRNGREPIRLLQALQTLVDAGSTAYIEVSPHPVLLQATRQCIAHDPRPAIALASLRRGEPERDTLLRSLAELYACGLDAAFPKLFPRGGKRVDLPTYSWEHELCGQESSLAAPAVAPATLREELAARSPSERRRALVDLVRQLVARTLGMTPERLPEVTCPFRDLHVTSLMAEELRHKLGRILDRRFPVSLLFDYPNIDALAGHLALGLAADRPPTSIKAPTQRLQRELDSLASPRDDVCEQEQRDRALSRGRGEPIAIIGMACRFPGAASAEAFWELLRDGRDAITEIPKGRWDADDFYDANANAPGRMPVRWGGFVEGIDRFDAEFFGIAPREAERMDPQQRLLLEVAWEALENAGHPPREGSEADTGVFIGMMNNNDYALLKAMEAPVHVTGHDSSGNACSIASGRLSYAFGFRGPSMSIDTACSSSLVAVHQAVQALRSGECRTALVGGVNAILAPRVTMEFARRRMLSPRGRCRTFDQSADGYVRGEGCGLLVLKCLRDAIADGDNIVGLLRGSAVNQDGRSSGLSAPSGLAQREVIRSALANADVSSAEVGYVEAHGTGTRLGDPIEGHALGVALRTGRSKGDELVVGSVKTNIGHLEAAAGVAGLIKVILALEHERIPPHLHLETLNSNLSLEEMCARIPTVAEPWPRTGRRRVAGVSSFGFSGTNAHAIVEEAPLDLRPTPSEGLSHVVCLSARSAAALDQLSQKLARFVVQDGLELHLADIARTSSVDRVHFTHRSAVVASTLGELAKGLRDLQERGPRDSRGLAVGDAEAKIEGVADHARTPRVAFVYSGNGLSDASRGAELYETEPPFRNALDRCTERCAKHGGPSIARSIFAPDVEGSTSAGQSPLYRQLSLFALQYALTELWRAWGVEPTFVMGDSFGECAAACAAGFLAVEDAIDLVVELARGDGNEERIASLVSLRREDAARSTANEAAPAIEMVSTRTGQLLRRDDPSYASHWIDLLREPAGVRAGVDLLVARGCDAFIEIGGAMPSAGAATWLSSLGDAGSERAQVLRTLAALYVRGVKVDWAELHRNHGGRRIPLPTYPFQGQPHWFSQRPTTPREEGAP
jgi:acyl transferase domain-containing protein